MQCCWFLFLWNLLTFEDTCRITLCYWEYLNNINTLFSNLLLKKYSPYMWTRFLVHKRFCLFVCLCCFVFESGICIHNWITFGSLTLKKKKRWQYVALQRLNTKGKLMSYLHSGLQYSLRYWIRFVHNYEKQRQTRDKITAGEICQGAYSRRSMITLRVFSYE